MIETKEKLLIDKIRLLCTQLEKEMDDQQPIVDKTIQVDTTLHLLLEMSCDYCWTFDPNTSLMIFHQMKSKTKEELPYHKSYSALMKGVNAEDQKIIFDAFFRILHFQSEREEIFFQREGVTNVYEYQIVCCPLIENGVMKVLGITRTLGIEKKALIQEEEKFNALMSLSNMYIWEYDIEKDTFFANSSLFRALHLEERVYRSDEVQALLDTPSVSKLKQMLLNDTLNEHAIISIGTKDLDNHLIFETNFRAIKGKHGGCQMVLGTLLDVTEREILKTTASKDVVTNCFNRRIAEMTLKSSFDKFCHNGEFFTLIFIDLDNFKHINDSYGHDMGDYVLRHVCEQIDREIRSSDMLCRWGGDEFLLICSGISKENIYAYIDRIRKLIERTDFVFNGEHVQTTISMGAAYYYKSDTSYEQAMKRADRSVYKSKLAGRNKVCILK